MRKNTTFMALNDSKRTIVAAIRRSGPDKPDVRSIPNELRHLRRLVERVKREGSVFWGTLHYLSNPLRNPLSDTSAGLGPASGLHGSPPCRRRGRHSRGSGRERVQL